MNMCAKAALLYSAMSVAATANADHRDEAGEAGARGSPVSTPRSKTSDALREERRTPADEFQWEAGTHGHGKIESVTAPGLSGLVSPGYDPRAR